MYILSSIEVSVSLRIYNSDLYQYPSNHLPIHPFIHLNIHPSIYIDTCTFPSTAYDLLISLDFFLCFSPTV